MRNTIFLDEGVDLRGEGRWDAPSTCAAISYAALSSPVLAILVAAEQYTVLRALMFLSWIPLVPAAWWRVAPLVRTASMPA